MHHNYSKEFIDRKWADMSSKLDTVLPVEADRSNDKLIWLLSSLLVVAVIAASYYGYMYKHVVPGAELTKEKVVYKNVYLTEAKDLYTSKETRSSTKSFQDQGVAQSIVSQKSLIPSESKINSTLLVEESISVASQSSQAEHALESEPIASLENIASKNSEIEARRQDLILENQSLQDFPKSRKIRIGAGLSALASHDKEITGYGVATNIDIPLSKRFGLNTGVAFNSLSKEHYFINAFDRNEEIQNLPQAPQPRNAPIVYTDELRSLKQVAIPLGLNYSLTNAISLNSGVRVRYTYGAELDKAPRNPSESSLLDQTNVGFSAGLQYKLTKHFSILLDSEWGMGSLSRSSEITNSSMPTHDLNLFNLTTNLKF